MIRQIVTDSNQQLYIKTFPHKLSDPFTMRAKFNYFHEYKWAYRISANSFRGNYSFLKFYVQRSQYISIKFPLHKPSENRGNYSREETIQGRKLFAEIRYTYIYQKYKSYVSFIKSVLLRWKNNYTMGATIKISSF